MMGRLNHDQEQFSLEPISKSFEEDDEASELHEAKEVLRIKLPADKDAALPLNPGEEAVRPTSAWHIAEVGVHLASRTCGDWSGAARPSRCRLCVSHHRVDRCRQARSPIRVSGLASIM